MKMSSLNIVTIMNLVCIVWNFDILQNIHSPNYIYTRTDDQAVEAEIEENDSMLAEFDGNFPLRNNAINDGEDRNTKIMKIIRKCAEEDVTFRSMSISLPDCM